MDSPDIFFSAVLAAAVTVLRGSFSGTKGAAKEASLTAVRILANSNDSGSGATAACKGERVF